MKSWLKVCAVPAGLITVLLATYDYSHFIVESPTKTQIKASTCDVVMANVATLLEKAPVDPVTGQVGEFVKAVQEGAIQGFVASDVELDLLVVLNAHRAQWQHSTRSATTVSAMVFGHRECMKRI